MKILVLSDTHHNIRLMNTIIDKEKPDMLIHLGDCLDDMENNPLIYALPCNSVPGNCDYDYPSEDKVFHLFKNFRLSWPQAASTLLPSFLRSVALTPASSSIFMNFFIVHPHY